MFSESRIRLNFNLSLLFKFIVCWLKLMLIYPSWKQDNLTLSEAYSTKNELALFVICNALLTSVTAVNNVEIVKKSNFYQQFLLLRPQCKVQIIN